MINSNQFTSRLTDAQVARLNKLFPDLSQKEIFNILFENNENPPQPDNSELKKECKKHFENFKSANLKIDELNLKVAELEAREPEIRELETRMEVPVERELADNEILLTLPEPANSLLREYARRMDVAPQSILIDMFVRYVTEQYNHWFFDFLVKKSEFKDVCGFSHSEVINWLRTVADGRAE